MSLHYLVKYQCSKSRYSQKVIQKYVPRVPILSRWDPSLHLMNIVSSVHPSPHPKRLSRFAGLTTERQTDICINAIATDRGAEYCDERVCLSVCVCLSAIISSALHDRASPTFFMHVTCGRGSVLLWRRRDALYTSGFVDDVIIAQPHKPRLLDVAAQLKRSAHAALGLAIYCAQ